MQLSKEPVSAVVGYTSTTSIIVTKGHFRCLSKHFIYEEIMDVKLY